MTEDPSNWADSEMTARQPSNNASQEPTPVGGDYVNVNFEEIAGVIIVGIIALVLLWALLRSEARNRDLWARLRPADQ